MGDSINIVLTGFMGTGKSAVGRILAAKLRYEWVDTDSLIESRHGPIPQLFTDKGEDHFLQIERGVAKELALQRRLVISTGGRMMLDDAARDTLAEVSRIFCLVASPEVILWRVGGEQAAMTRPALAGPSVKARIAELLDERSTSYDQFEQIDTENRRPSDVAEHIAELVTSGE